MNAAAIHGQRGIQGQSATLDVQQPAVCKSHGAQGERVRAAAFAEGACVEKPLAAPAAANPHVPLHVKKRTSRIHELPVIVVELQRAG